MATTLIEQAASVENGLAQRFLWLIPEPSYSAFNTLEPADEDFVLYLSELTYFSM